MPRAMLLLTVWQGFSTRQGAAGERIEVRNHPGQHTQNPGAITGHTRRRFLARGAPMHHDVIRMCQRLQPGHTLAEDLHCIGHVAPARGRRCGWHAFWLHCRCEALVLALTEPHGERTRFVCLTQLRNPGRTHAGGTRALPDRQPGLLSRHTSPDPCALGVGQPRQGTAASGDHLWLTTDTQLQGFRGFHARKDSRFSFRCTANCTPPPDLLRVCSSHPALAYLREAEGLARTRDDPRRLGWVSAYGSGHHVHTGGHVTEMRTFVQRVRPSPSVSAMFRSRSQLSAPLPPPPTSQATIAARNMSAGNGCSRSTA